MPPFEPKLRKIASRSRACRSRRRASAESRATSTPRASVAGRPAARRGAPATGGGAGAASAAASGAQRRGGGRARQREADDARASERARATRGECSRRRSIRTSPWPRRRRVAHVADEADRDGGGSAAGVIGRGLRARRARRRSASSDARPCFRTAPTGSDAIPQRSRSAAPITSRRAPARSCRSSSRRAVMSTGGAHATRARARWIAFGEVREPSGRALARAEVLRFAPAPARFSRRARMATPGSATAFARREPTHVRHPPRASPRSARAVLRRRRGDSSSRARRPPPPQSPPAPRRASDGAAAASERARARAHGGVAALHRVGLRWSPRAAMGTSRTRRRELLLARATRRGEARGARARLSPRALGQRARARATTDRARGAARIVDARADAPWRPISLSDTHEGRRRRQR